MRKDSPKSKKQLIVIGGPTAVGKTSLTVDLAKALDTVVISCDSRQFYKEMAIGTAKPSSEEMGNIPHHFIDSHSIHDGVYTAGKYEFDCIQLLQKLFETHDSVILTGGSGLYMHGVLHGIDNIPTPKPEVKIQLIQLHQEKGIEALQKLLQEHDANYYEQVDIHNPVRLIRALEVCLSTGLPYSSFLSQSKKERDFQVKGFVLNREREELYERINQRVLSMVDEGLLKEAEKLYAFKDHPALKTVGYSEIFSFLEKELTWEEAIAKIQQNTRRYAKRQLTWFRRENDFHWVHPDRFSIDLIQ